MNSYLTKIPWFLICPFLVFLTEIFNVIDQSFRVPKIISPLLSQDVAIITGGSRGLGEEMVRQLSVKYKLKHVYMIDINDPIFESSNVTFFKCDVGNKEAYANVLLLIIKSCDSLDYKVSLFINNAGIRHSKSLLNLDDETIMNLYNVNLFSFIWGIKFLLKHHLETNPGGKFSIVTISSVLGHLAPRNLTIYSSTKAALTQVHEGLQEELLDYPNIRMLLVLPGQLLCGMFDDVQPSRLFFAPIVSHLKLANEILESVNKGECGVLNRPLYATLLPIVNCLPYSIVRLCRRFSEMDEKVKDN